MLLLVLAACGETFDPGSQIEGLRVLGVRKSSPYVQPGQAVELELLWHDTDAPRDGQLVPEIAWAALCENPPGDLFELCFSQLPDADDVAERISLPVAGSGEPNDDFSYTTSADLISSRPLASDGNPTPYGLNYVFFAVCAGHLTQLSGGGSMSGGGSGAAGLPFGCYEERDGEPGFSAGDEQVDSSGFVVGYTAVFAYEELTNANPIVNGIELNGTVLWPAGAPDAPDGAVTLAAPDLCIGSSCTPPPSDDSADCPDELTLATCKDCDGVSVQPVIDPVSAELDEAATRRGSTRLLEQMWVNYYAARGTVDEEVRLLNDATVGWNTDFGTTYQPGAEPGVAYVWAVAHDNRGGTEWVRLRLCIE